MRLQRPWQSNKAVPKKLVFRIGLNAVAIAVHHLLLLSGLTVCGPLLATIVENSHVFMLSMLGIVLKRRRLNCKKCFGACVVVVGYAILLFGGGMGTARPPSY